MKTLISIIKMLMLGLLIFLGIYIYSEVVEVDIKSDVEEFISNITISDKNIKEDKEIVDIIDFENKEESKGEVNKSNTNDFFYNQIDEYAKIIYEEIKNNKENMKTGDYQINFENKFSKLLNSENGDEILKNSYQTAIESYIYDNPDTFYIDYSKLCLNIETTKKFNKKTYKVYIKSENEGNYLDKEFSSKEKIDKALEEIEKIREYFIQNKKTNEYENVKLVHDYLIQSIEYDQTLSKSNIYNLYGAMINKSCVCEGYAESFKYLMDSLDIPCIVVIGKATNSQGNTEGHAWNYVQLNEKWYAIDCTWDDPIIEGPGFIRNSQKYKYFLKGEKEFSKTHTPIGELTESGKIYTYPVLNSENY